MDQVNMAAPTGVDAAGFVTIDAACRRCSYNVRGLRYDGRCPECGTPVGLSIYGDLLRFADPQWLEKLATGISYILWGILVGLLVGFFGAFVARGNPFFESAFKLIGGALGLYGAWLLTEPDPSGLNEGNYVTARKIMRLALLTGVAVNVLTVLTGTQHWPPLMAMLLVVVSAAGGIMSVIGEFAKLYYLEMLAKRIPNDQLAKRANFLRWAYGISLAAVVSAGVFVGLLALAGAGGAAGGVMALGACIAIPAGLALFIFGIMVLILLYRMGQALREQAGLARQIWATTAAATPAQP